MLTNCLGRIMYLRMTESLLSILRMNNFLKSTVPHQVAVRITRSNYKRFAVPDIYVLILVTKNVIVHKL